jgi:hypothetical protein
VRWLEERAGCVLTRNARVMKVVDDTGRTRGAVAYDDIIANGSCEVHMAVDTPWAWRRLIPACFIYPFITLGLRVVVGVTPGGNARALAVNKHLGFRETYRVRDGWAEGVDMVVQELRPEDVKQWLSPLKKAV